MLTLAIETVTRRGSLATCHDDPAAGEGGTACDGRVGTSTPTHGERLPGDVTAWLAARGWTLTDVNLFAVVTGPGSFTGLRVGIAAAQGFALAGGRPIVSVPTMDAMVAAWLPKVSEPDTAIVTCLDGQRGEVFTSAVVASPGASLASVVPLLEPMAARPAELAELLRRRLAGRRVTIVCDEARRWEEVLGGSVPGGTFADLPVSLAESAARLAAASPERATSPHAVRPVYLRRPAVSIRPGRGGAAGTPPYTIRRAAGPEDLAAVDALQRQTFTNPWGAEAIRWELEHTDVSRLYVMHDDSGALVAYCACWMVFDELHINSLAVDLERRRRGLARRLLEHVLSEAVAAGANAATLEVRRSNTAARALYERLGFAIEGVRRDYYQDPREDAVILWKRGLTEVKG